MAVLCVLLFCFAWHARYMVYGVVVGHFLLFCFVWHARYMAHGVFFPAVVAQFTAPTPTEQDVNLTVRGRGGQPPPPPTPPPAPPLRAIDASDY